MTCVVYWCCFFFFFKQKTAYEMRISDWSSDVCSSDLRLRPRRSRRGPRRAAAPGSDRGSNCASAAAGSGRWCSSVSSVLGAAGRHASSEEHTSELQSLMRISYAVFCLKKKKTKTANTHNRGYNTKANKTLHRHCTPLQSSR